MAGLGTTDTVALTVHGERGAVDLVVPLGATVGDVAREYAAASRLPEPPPLVTSLGRPLDAAGSLASAGVVTGDVLVASLGASARRTPTAKEPVQATDETSRGVQGLFVVAGVLAVCAGVLATGAGPQVRDWAVGVLLGGMVLGVAPAGRHAASRAAAAPAFAAGAAYAIAWEPGQDALLLTIGIASLAAAVVAAVVRATSDLRVEVPNVWIAGGLTAFTVAVGCAVLGFPPQVAWATLLTLALLASRFVPTLAIDVPDQMLIDLEKLAVNAWSARDRMTGRRGRIVVPQAGVAELMARGARIVTAACVGVLVAVVVATPNLLAVADASLDRPGALTLVFFVGAGLLLAGRSYRHRLAAAMLRLAGVYCWAVLAFDLLWGWPDADLAYVAVLAPACAAGALAAGVATGRGWRSVWWARRAEIAEVLCGAGAVAALFVAAGLFRHLWEFTS